MTDVSQIITLTPEQRAQVHGLRNRGWSVTAIARHVFAEAKPDERAGIEATIATHLGVMWPGAVTIGTQAERVELAKDKAAEALAAKQHREAVKASRARLAAEGEKAAACSARRAADEPAPRHGGKGPGNGHVLQPHQERRLRAMVRDGFSVGEVAASLRVDAKTVERHAKAMGVRFLTGRGAAKRKGTG